MPLRRRDDAPLSMRGVAQLGRALVLGTRGRRFKSCHPDLQRQPFILKGCLCKSGRSSFHSPLGVLKMREIERAKRPFDLPHLSPTVTVFAAQAAELPAASNPAPAISMQVCHSFFPTDRKSEAPVRSPSSFAHCDSICGAGSRAARGVKSCTCNINASVSFLFSNRSKERSARSILQTIHPQGDLIALLEKTASEVLSQVK